MVENFYQVKIIVQHFTLKKIATIVTQFPGQQMLSGFLNYVTCMKYDCLIWSFINVPVACTLWLEENGNKWLHKQNRVCK